MKFKVGDRIIAAGTYNKPLRGLTGTIIALADDDDDDEFVSVEFDEYIDGHQGYDDDGKPGHCWNVDESSLKLIKDEKDEPVRVGGIIKVNWKKK